MPVYFDQFHSVMNGLGPRLEQSRLDSRALPRTLPWFILVHGRKRRHWISQFDVDCGTLKIPGLLYYVCFVREYLDDAFENRWIGRRGTIEWPARSPGLTPLDFFPLGLLKRKKLKSRPSDIITELKNRIIDAMGLIPPAVMENVTAEFSHRLRCYLVVDGQHFEHLI
jgi:hypothetical protein